MSIGPDGVVTYSPVGRGCQSVPSSSKVLVIMAEQRSDFYVGEKFSTYEEIADIEFIFYLLVCAYANLAKHSHVFNETIHTAIYEV